MKVVFFWLPPFERWGSVLLLAAGTLLVYPFAPWLWACGPFGLLRRVMALASQESGFVSDIRGDTGSSKGDSVGVLQYDGAKEGWYPWFPGDWRESPFMSGWAVGRFWRGAGFRWWLAIATPVLGAPLFQWGWGRGTGASPPWGNLRDVLDNWGLNGEKRDFGAYVAWLTLTGLPSLWLWRWIWPKLWRRKGAR